ncbi:NAD(P)-dependent oxidoreductase [Sphingomonas soli]|uniref:NAD(P)-dependent oxidoreductase n=1 Tax=Sphingomonas soli TaxID=266127 RepID=UPI00083559C5|nr:NAD(P)-dependent oxidoreductase [Sphingomonas soli]
MERIALIGFGEAGAAFAEDADWRSRACAYDLKTDDAASRAAKLSDYQAAGVAAALSAREALDGAQVIFCLVTADQALGAAQAAAVTAGALWLDCNSVAPETKRAAAQAVEAAGGRYVDVAVMSPVRPARRGVPLLLSGPHAEDAAAALRTLGFAKVRVVDGPVGAASSIKMIRSVMVKGLEALSAECALAAEAAGVRDEVLASLDASWREESWTTRFDYNLDRMLVHGTRRAAEMEEVVKTLEALGTGAAMSRGTVERQRALGRLGVSPPDGLDAKLAEIGKHI